MDRVRYRNKVLVDLLTAPWTLWPSVAGLSTLMVGWAWGDAPGALIMAGIGGLLVGVGSLASRWLLRREVITREAFEELQGEERRSREKRLDDLDARLQADEDPRTELALRKLRSLHRDFEEDRDWTRRFGAKTAFEIANSVEKLFKESIISLERTLQLHEAARKMRTRKGRDSLFESREAILEEIEKNVAQLARTLDDLYALELQPKDDVRLARLRSELEQSLEVAHRVDERLQSLEDELDRGVRLERE